VPALPQANPNFHLIFGQNLLDASQRTPLRNSALASGLLTLEQLHEAETQACARNNLAKPSDATDAQLGAVLEELGWLNHWQVEQLKSGRSRFTLKDYQVIDSIGQGGMGQVFKAEHTMMGRVVAIKVLPRHKSTPEAIASFTREMRAQAQLDHENLVRALDAGRDGNVYFLVTEYVPGTDLRKMLRTRGKLSMQEAATIVSQAAAGLAHAHSRGMIHRDVKPGNLLVTPTGHTKVSDLGLAGFLDDAFDDDPRAGKIVGTADYLSPEQIMTPREITPASDIYSLGCTLYYAVTGKVPFPGGTTREKTRRHCEDTPINPRRLNPDLSDEFLDVLAAMMEKDPNKRIRTATDVSERLAPWAADAVSMPAEDAGQTIDSDSHWPVASSSTIRRRQDSPSPDSPGDAMSGVPAALNDTEDGFFDQAMAPAVENLGEAAEGTESVVAASEETDSDLSSQPARTQPAASRPAASEEEPVVQAPEPQPPAPVSVPLVLASMLPLMLAAGVLVVSVILSAIW